MELEDRFSHLLLIFLKLRYWELEDLKKKQVFLDGKFVTRTMLPLSLSYDHRIIDGAEAARFNNELKENLGKNFAYKLAV